jgi:hypothetical protein
MRRFRLWRARLVHLLSFRLDDWCVLFESVGTLVVVKVLLHVVEFPRLLAWTTRVTPKADADWTRARVENTAWLVGLASRLTRLSCLPRSLTLAHVLARRGVATEVRIGVQTANGVLAAHAWVEWSGHALNDDPSHVQEFAPFERLMAFPGETSHV